MRPRVGMRVRTVMAITALIALGFGTTIELHRHASRDRRHNAQRRLYRIAAFHLKRALDCRSAEDRLLPYRRAERLKQLSGDPMPGTLPGGGFGSWDAEREYHVYWANRLYDQAEYDGGD